jgi:hypothetical protein
MRTKCVTPLTNFEARSYKPGKKPLKLQGQKLAFEARIGLRMMPTVGIEIERAPL